MPAWGATMFVDRELQNPTTLAKREPKQGGVEMTALLVNHQGDHCGVYQFGRRLYDTLAASPEISWHYAECNSLEALLRVEDEIHPEAILLNYHPFTMPWVSDELRRTRSPVLAVFHEANQVAVDRTSP